ncbi:ferric reductase-like transmembrane domain-containing protein [Streptomyces sp. KLOTTS4A1]|uniref:ferredoxin reductase family protein n=1 Tax=Streptomyces sp. KLOTTS4A1 TaxID=3390996 RepID=UPI0039F5B8EB
MATTSYGRAGRRQARRRVRRRRSPAIPLLVSAWGGAAAVVWLWWQNTPAVLPEPGDRLIHAGRITGLLAGYVMALVVVQMARVPALERRVGSDRVSRWHATSGRYALSLTLAHVVLTVCGYALQGRIGVVAQTVSLVTEYPETGKAAAGTALLLLVGLVSAGAARRRMRYEVWYYLHLLTYLAVFLAFWHQLATGAEFIGSPLARRAWYALYGTVAVLLLWYRVLTPIRLNLVHRLRVEEVVPEAPGVVSVYLRGRRLHRLGAEAGQFFRWRFLTAGMWWTANPYSLSAPPRPDLLRITVKAVGGHSSALVGLRPGTRVWAEGPYGSMTAARRSRGKVLLIAGGAGITPLRALFETLPGAGRDLTLLYRARTADDLALREELEAIADERGAQLLYAVNGPGGKRPAISAKMLRGILPDIARHDVYVCGPQGLAEESYAALREAGVPDRRIHHESFAF